MKLVGENVVVHEKVREFSDSFFMPLSEELGIIRMEAEHERIPIILKETESFICQLLRMQRPLKILEIGTAIGYSSMIFSSICKDAKIYTCDVDDELITRAKENFRRLNYHNIYPYICDGGELIEMLLEKGENNFDFAFIDGAKSHYLRFYKAMKPLMKKGGIVLSDNIYMNGLTVGSSVDKKRRHRTNIRHMHEFINYLMKEDECSTGLFSVGDGVALTII